MIKKFLELIKFNKIKEPELDYIEYEDSYIQNLNNNEEIDNELLEKNS
jgi:hypothetical protein|tara:strand:+ start:225 stop:368 length:144 start_codon:yes stop_codon:yes gene_type:complete